MRRQYCSKRRWSAVVTDMRGDSYYSPVVEAHFKNGKASDLKVNPEFVGGSN